MKTDNTNTAQIAILLMLILLGGLYLGQALLPTIQNVINKTAGSIRNPRIEQVMRKA